MRVREDVAKKCGLHGDAPTGDGLLVRSGGGGDERSVEEVIERMQEQVREATDDDRHTDENRD